MTMIVEQKANEILNGLTVSGEAKDFGIVNPLLLAMIVNFIIAIIKYFLGIKASATQTLDRIKNPNLFDRAFFEVYSRRIFGRNHQKIVSHLTKLDYNLSEVQSMFSEVKGVNIDV